MVEVSAAIAKRRKNMADQIIDPSIWLKSPGTVIKSNPGPPATSSETMVSGFVVNAKADGKMTIPARSATRVSRTETWTAVAVKFVLSLK